VSSLTYYCFILFLVKEFFRNYSIQHCRAIAMAVSSRSPTAGIWIWFKFKACGTCGGQIDTGIKSLLVLRFPCQFSYHQLLRIHNYHHPGLVQEAHQRPTYRGHSFSPPSCNWTKYKRTEEASLAESLQTCALEPRSQHRLSWLRIFVVCVSPPWKCQDSTSIKPWLFPSKSSLVHHSSFIRPFDAI
jgi:hypothetical protein